MAAMTFAWLHTGKHFKVVKQHIYHTHGTRRLPLKKMLSPLAKQENKHKYFRSGQNNIPCIEIRELNPRSIHGYTFWTMMVDMEAQSKLMTPSAVM